MKKLHTNRSGFTLLEIIIVIIIVGVLASLALPRFFETVEFSRSSEAMTALGIMKRFADQCAMMGGTANDYSNCTTFDALGMEDPANSPNSHFTYTIGWVDPDLTLTATRNTVENGDGASTVSIVLDTGAGTVTRAGTGEYISIQ